MDSVLTLLKWINDVGDRVREHYEGIVLTAMLLVIGPAFVLIGLHSLPPPWRPGLHWPIHGERATATLQSVRLMVRHPVGDANIDNVQVSANAQFTYVDRAGSEQHAQLAGPWMMQTAMQQSGDAVWLYLQDIAHALGPAALSIDMPRDMAGQLAVPHQEFEFTREKTASNLDRPLRWIAFGWLAPQQPLSVRYDPQRPAVAVPEFLIERESTRLHGVGVLRIGAFVLGCLLVGVLAWNVFAFPWRWLRAVAALLVVGTVLWWAPYVSTMLRFVVPGIGGWKGVDIEEVVADPLAGMYDEFRDGPYYIPTRSTPRVEGVTWTPDDLNSHALTKWLRTVPVIPVHGSLEDAENALTQAALRSVASLPDADLIAIGTELRTIALREHWDVEHYAQLREAVRTELEHRGVPNGI